MGKAGIYFILSNLCGKNVLKPFFSGQSHERRTSELHGQIEVFIIQPSKEHAKRKYTLYRKPFMS